MLRKAWSVVRWPLLFVALFLLITGARATYSWPDFIFGTFWWGDSIKKVFLHTPQNIAAPDFEIEDLNGLATKLSDFKGRPVLLVFWAYYCGPCRKEMPFLKELHKQYYTKKGLEILAITNDEEKWLVETFVKEKNIPFRVFHDPEEKIRELYNVDSIPRTFFIDRDGVVRQEIKGYEPDKHEEYYQMVKNLF